MKKLLLLLLVSSYCFASTEPKPFKGINAPPNKVVDLMIPRGLHDKDMHLSCDFENINYNNQYPIIISIGHKNIKYKLNNLITHIVLEHDHRIGEPDSWPIMIRNYDDTDSVTVKNCLSSYY